MHEDKIITEKKKLHFEAQSLGQNIDACLVLVKKKNNIKTSARCELHQKIRLYRYGNLQTSGKIFSVYELQQTSTSYRLHENTYLKVWGGVLEHKDLCGGVYGGEGDSLAVPAHVVGGVACSTHRPRNITNIK
jgi:hypothetical protein